MSALTEYWGSLHIKSIFSVMLICGLSIKCVIPDCISPGALNLSRPFLCPGLIKNISPNGNIVYTAYIQPGWGGYLCKN